MRNSPTIISTKHNENCRGPIIHETNYNISGGMVWCRECRYEKSNHWKDCDLCIKDRYHAYCMDCKTERKHRTFRHKVGGYWKCKGGVLCRAKGLVHAFECLLCWKRRKLKVGMYDWTKDEKIPTKSKQISFFNKK